MFYGSLLLLGDPRLLWNPRGSVLSLVLLQSMGRPKKVWFLGEAPQWGCFLFGCLDLHVRTLAFSPKAPTFLALGPYLQSSIELGALGFSPMGRECQICEGSSSLRCQCWKAFEIIQMLLECWLSEGRVFILFAKQGPEQGLAHSTHSTSIVWMIEWLYSNLRSICRGENWA